MMRPREFITLLGGAAAALPATQRARRHFTASASLETEARHRSKTGSRVFALACATWVMSKARISTLSFDGPMGSLERLADVAAELVRLQVELIVTWGTPGTRAAMMATRTIPIVMAISGDAVATGIIASLANPGGNVTGTTQFNPEICAKRLELIKEAAPRTNGRR